MKKLFVVGLVVILMVGVVFAWGSPNKSWYGHKTWKKAGDFDMSAWLEKMGLDPDASEEEIIAAKKALWEGKEAHNWEEEKAAWLEKMGLPADATEEEMIAAKKAHWGGKAGHNWGDGKGFHGFEGCSKCPMFREGGCGMG